MGSLSSLRAFALIRKRRLIRGRKRRVRRRGGGGDLGDGGVALRVGGEVDALLGEVDDPVR